MTEKIEPEVVTKFKSNNLVRDDSLNIEYVIEKFSYRQKNMDIWYSAFKLPEYQRVTICESWLVLVKPFYKKVNTCES